jgi:ubiquinone/menaquinone biosynthesis C-methylase UbiE
MDLTPEPTDAPAGGAVADRAQFESFYVRKWNGQAGLWIDRYPSEHRAFALAVYGRRNAEILEAAGPAPGRVLDLGCGVGDIASGLAGRARSVVASDIASENVRRTRENLSLTGSNGAVVQAAGERLPFADATLDTVVIADVIEHVASVRGTLDEVARVLRPGGRMICVTPIRFTLQTWRVVDWLARWVARPRRRPPFAWRSPEVPERFLSKREVRRAIGSAGLTPVRFRRVCFWPAPETAGAFGEAIARIVRRDPARGAAVTGRVVHVVEAVEHLRVLNQKQLWVAVR